MPVLIDIDRMSHSRSGLGKRTALVSTPASAIAALIRSLASSRSMMVNVGG